MKNISVSVLFSVCFAFSAVSASYSGPFLFWGVDHLNDMKIPTLQAIDDKVLRDIYSGATSIAVFIRNATTKLNYENFPKLSEIIGTSEWLYLPQEILSSDPLEYNVNAEVFTLTGPVEQQDVEIAALYRDAQVSFGKKNVLGILATRNEHIEHSVYKREASDRSTTESPATTSLPADDPVREDTFYKVPGRAFLYTTEIPILKYEDTTYSLSEHAMVSADERNKNLRLVINFIHRPTPTDQVKIAVRLVFKNPKGSWYMSTVEVDIANKSMTLKAIGEYPSAPIGFSYACGGVLTFRNENGTSFTLKRIQVQPTLDASEKFNKPYDCVGIMTPAIISGIFVAFILGTALCIAITAILDIKPPNKFESRSSKQLSFTIQE